MVSEEMNFNAFMLGGQPIILAVHAPEAFKTEHRCIASLILRASGFRLNVGWGWLQGHTEYMQQSRWTTFRSSKVLSNSETGLIDYIQ